MRGFAIYVATGVMVGFLLVAALCVLGLASHG
jgi:threonine/homoserine/homoserine lactone efflux protein